MRLRGFLLYWGKPHAQNISVRSVTTSEYFTGLKRTGYARNVWLTEVLPDSYSPGVVRYQSRFGVADGFPFLASEDSAPGIRMTRFDAVILRGPSQVVTGDASGSLGDVPSCSLHHGDEIRVVFAHSFDSSIFVGGGGFTIK